MHDSPLFPRTPGPGALTSRPLRGCTGLALAGEADWPVKDILRAALAALPAGDVHLDLSRLRFADLSCTRELLAAARNRRGARLIVHQPPYSLRRIAAIICPQAPVEFTDTPVTEAPPAPKGPWWLRRASATWGAGRRAPVPLAWILP